MNQTKSYFPLIFISLEDEPWEPIEPNPNAAPAEEPVAAEPGLSESDWTLASTETVTHEYLTQNGKVARETIRQDVGGTVLKTETLDFFYDESGRPFAFNYSVDGDIASTYYYILNLQGDVVQIIDANGVMQAEYVYSPWGEIISAEGDLAEINPLRYRGYYYDSETGFYYLRSRYYDPENHRFINADSIDAILSAGDMGCNMYSYCYNSPINQVDENGRLPQWVKDGCSWFNQHSPYYQKYVLLRVVDIWRRPVVRLAPTARYSESMCIGLYGWWGDQIPDAAIVKGLKFVPMDTVGPTQMWCVFSWGLHRGEKPQITLIEEDLAWKREDYPFFNTDCKLCTYTDYAPFDIDLCRIILPNL